MKITIIIFIIIFFIIIMAAIVGGAVWFTSRARRLTPNRKPTRDTGEKGRLPFHWSYIILPVVILLLSTVLSAYFYHLLPAEVAYHFKLDGTPDRWLSREISIILMLIPQLFLTLLAGAIIWGIIKLGILSGQTPGAWIKPERMLSLMGNMIGLPQLIIGFAMLDIFSYNSYQTHIMPMWIFLLITLGLATIALGLLFVLAISKVRRAPISQRRANSD